MIHIQRKLQTIIASFLTAFIFAGIAPIRINAMDRDDHELIEKEASSLKKAAQIKKEEDEAKRKKLNRKRPLILKTTLKIIITQQQGVIP